MNVNLDTIYYDFNDSLLKFIHGRVDDHDTAEDILQDVYLKIHSSIGSVRDTSRLTSWIYQITRNAIIDQYRRARPQSELQEDYIAPQVEDPDIYAELASSVRGMLNCLVTSDRQVLELADLHGIKQDEIAKQLGISLSGTKSRIQRARQKLKQIFLDCCHFELDHHGRVMDFQSNCDHCTDEPSLSNPKDDSCEKAPPSSEQRCLCN